MRYDAVKGFWIEVAPGSKLDYGFDYSAHLDPGDTIATSEWAPDNTGVTLSGATFEGLKTIVWVDGIAPGSTHRITNTVVTAANRKFVRTMLLVGKVL